MMEFDCNIYCLGSTIGSESTGSTTPPRTTHLPSTSPTITMTASSTVERAVDSPVLVVTLVSVGVVIAVIIIIAISLIAAIAFVYQSHRMSSINMSNFTLQDEISKEDVVWEKPNRESIISTPENNVNLPDVDPATGIRICSDKEVQM